MQKRTPRDPTRKQRRKGEKHEIEIANKTRSWQDNGRISVEISEESGSWEDSKVSRAGRAG
jgi:hypothetical protein